MSVLLGVKINLKHLRLHDPEDRQEHLLWCVTGGGWEAFSEPLTTGLQEKSPLSFGS